MPQVLFKIIKAKMPDWQAFYKEIGTTLDTVVKPELLAYFERVVKPWNNPPEFRARKRIRQDSYSVYVYPIGPNADIWRYVSKGTRSHPIPRPGNTRAKMLRFKTGYKPRTNTGGGYRGPGKATGKVVFAKSVNHPGNKARNFEKHIARWYAPQFKRTMNAAIKRGVRAAKRGSK